MPKSITVFVSHDASEVELANGLIANLKQLFPSLNFFLSSSYESLMPGDDWWNVIKYNFNNVRVVLACISRQSKDRPWILFESGIGLGRGAVLIPVILDDLPNSNLREPLSKFQIFRIDDSIGFEHLVKQIAVATDVQVPRLQNGKSFLLKSKVSKSYDTSMGFYPGTRRLDITNGWMRYLGNQQYPEICKGYLSFGSSFDNAFRYPPNDILNAPWKYWGFRIRRQNDVNVYAAVKLLDDSDRMIYVSTKHSSWGFIGQPKTEYCVPLSYDIPKNTWQVIFVDVSTLEIDFPQPIKAIVGVRVRGPLQLSHIWCVKDLNQIPHKYRSEAKLISYPR